MVIDLRIFENPNGTKRLQALVAMGGGIDETGGVHVEPGNNRWMDAPMYRHGEWELDPVHYGVVIPSPKIGVFGEPQQHGR